jgi:hypothetical protein
MELKDYPDWHGIVAANWQKTTGYLLALDGLCLEVRDDELAAIRKNRVLVGLAAKDLAAWRPPDSWLLAVILCPGDSVEPIVEWVEKHGAEVERIHFYVHDDADAFAALHAWAEAGLPDPIVDDGIDSWKAFHKKFGNDLAIRILEDWG